MFPFFLACASLLLPMKPRYLHALPSFIPVKLRAVFLISDFTYCFFILSHPVMTTATNKTGTIFANFITLCRNQKLIFNTKLFALPVATPSRFGCASLLSDQTRSAPRNPSIFILCFLPKLEKLFLARCFYSICTIFLFQIQKPSFQLVYGVFGCIFNICIK